MKYYHYSFLNLLFKLLTVIRVLEKNKEYISLIDILKAKEGDFLFPIGFVTEIQLNILEFGKVFTTPILIMANSPQIEVKPDCAATK